MAEVKGQSDVSNRRNGRTKRQHYKTATQRETTGKPLRWRTFDNRRGAALIRLFAVQLFPLIHRRVRHAVFLVKPAAEVNLAAALGTERHGRRQVRFEGTAADGTRYAVHGIYAKTCALRSFWRA